MYISLQDKLHGLVSITMNHDAKCNALSAAMIDEMRETLHLLERDNVRAVILRANPGVKVWSAGHSLDELHDDGHDPLSWMDPLRQIVRDIEKFPAPIIAMIEGSVWGGACEVVFACDLVVATPESTFAATPAKLGVPYNSTGLLTFLNAAHLHVAKEMLFTAQPIPASRLEKYGVINRLAPADELEAACLELGRAIANNAPLAVAVMKEQLRILANAHAMSPNDFERIQSLRRMAYNSEDYCEGIHAVKERRKPNFQGQ